MHTATLPAVHTLDVIELVGRWNISPERLLAGLDVSPASIAAPNARLPLPLVTTLIERARALTGEAALGFYLGLKMRVSAHGFLGFAAMTANTVRDALTLATRFAPTRTTALSLHLSENAGQGTLTISEHADFGPARDVIIFALLTGLWRIGAELTGTALSGHADVAFPAPAYVARVCALNLVPGPIRFDQDAHRLVFDASILDLPLAMADPTALSLAQEQCERELAALGFSDHFAPRVTALFGHGDGARRTLPDIARALGVSARSLKRHLALEGTTYSELRDAWLRDRASVLLRQASMNVENVAELLGYSDAANFTRAFVRWFGVTPGVWRKAMASSIRPNHGF